MIIERGQSRKAVPTDHSLAGATHTSQAASFKSELKTYSTMYNRSCCFLIPQSISVCVGGGGGACVGGGGAGDFCVCVATCIIILMASLSHFLPVSFLSLCTSLIPFGRPGSLISVSLHDLTVSLYGLTVSLYLPSPCMI